MASKEDIINLLRDLDSEFDEIGNYASEAESDLSNSEAYAEEVTGYAEALLNEARSLRDNYGEATNNLDYAQSSARHGSELIRDLIDQVNALQTEAKLEDVLDGVIVSFQAKLKNGEVIDMQGTFRPVDPTVEFMGGHGVEIKEAVDGQ